MIPRFDGVILSLEWKEALWDVRHGSAMYCHPAGDLPGKSAERARTPSEQHTAIASFARGPEPRTWHQSQDCAEVRAGEGKLYLLFGIDRTSKFAVTHLVDKAGRKTAGEFPEQLLAAVPYRVHKIPHSLRPSAALD
ncbi:hypothetical protein [Primorskyibacter marinus]|uniref:hypothetical protein n=1 Tax=Primorskyibacter marinus TaxID=1977320 RepID=UPI0018E51274|nr:hypothetical protein [Primorskyibacter marinus]